MHLDFRYPKKSQKQKILSLIEKISKKFKGVSFKIEVEGDILNNSKKNKYIKKILKVAKKQGIKLKFYKAHGASDGRFFSAKSIPVIMFKPLCSEPHIDNEWIDLKSLEKFSQILKSFLVN